MIKNDFIGVFETSYQIIKNHI